MIVIVEQCLPLCPKEMFEMLTSLRLSSRHVNPGGWFVGSNVNNMLRNGLTEFLFKELSQVFSVSSRSPIQNEANFASCSDACIYVSITM